MKEYEIAFDGFEVKASSLLGASRAGLQAADGDLLIGGRIQTAARAIGVAQSAMEQALSYAQNRVQFGERS